MATTVFYIPNYNSFSVGTIGDLNAYSCIYAILFLSIIIVYVFKRTLWRSRKEMDLLILLRGVVWGIFFITLILQAAGQTRFFVDEIKYRQNKAVTERYPTILRETVSFARFCQSRLPAKSNCQFISDLDLSRDPGMFLNRFLAYHLYPVDIRGIRRDQNTSGCLIVFAAKNPDSHVPLGYDIVGHWGPHNLVAVKQPASP